MPDQASGTAPQPRCPQCGSAALSLLEFHSLAGGWGPDEWHINEDGMVVLHGHGWNEASPTGRWDLRCEDCGHQWKKRTPTQVVG